MGRSGVERKRSTRALEHLFQRVFGVPNTPIRRSDHPRASLLDDGVDALDHGAEEVLGGWKFSACCFRAPFVGVDHAIEI
jgi:hypothetical protein